MKKTNTLVILILISLFKTYGHNWNDSAYTYTVQTDIIYGTATNFLNQEDTLLMDIYTPMCENEFARKKFPLVVWIHGGAFLTGSKNDQTIESLCKKFAQQGYVAVSINYRLGFVGDEGLWQCNFPNYNCLFATDSAEWARAYHRAIQDANGAIRFLVNRDDEYQIDINNIFVGGESAGALTALGVGLMDTPEERLPQTYAISSVNKPNDAALNCEYNIGKTFPNTINRPDLGDYLGALEPTNKNFTIKGIANIFGAMPIDLLEKIPNNKTKPAIYSFHQPCDIIVPIDSGNVMWGLTWCMNNGYNCYGIVNSNFKLFGGRAFSNWNDTRNYGYTIQNEFTATNFPYQFAFVPASCVDQANNPCHAYDNFNLRAQNIANYFAPLITTENPCDSIPLGILEHEDFSKYIKIYPNPAQNQLTIEFEKDFSSLQYAIIDVFGRIHHKEKINNTKESIVIPIHYLSNGMYQINFKSDNHLIGTKLFIKQN